MHARRAISAVFKKVASRVASKYTASRTMTSLANYNFQTLNVTKPKEYVIQVELNRPEKRNAMNMVFWREMKDCFNQLAEDGDCRAVVISGAGKSYTSGIDLTDLMQVLEEMEIGRKGFMIRKFVFDLQKAFNAIETCPKPVIAAVHNACIGGGVDMITACDIRLCSEDAYFQVKEVDVGLVADLGTIQRLPKVIGSQSLVRELVYTGRTLVAKEAKECGLVSAVQCSKESTIEAAIAMATTIAEKSPIAVQGSKVNLNYARDHSVADGLDYVVTWNQCMLQSEDVMKSVLASVQKEKAVFSKL